MTYTITPSLIWNLLLWAHGPSARTASQGLVLWWSSLWCHLSAEARSNLIFIFIFIFIFRERPSMM